MPRIDLHHYPRILMLLDCSVSMGIVPTSSTSLVSNTRTKNVEKQPKMKGTPGIYRLHQIEQGIIGSDSIGGQCRPIVVKHYLHQRVMSFYTIQNLFSKSKP